MVIRSCIGCLERKTTNMLSKQRKSSKIQFTKKEILTLESGQLILMENLFKIVKIILIIGNLLTLCFSMCTSEGDWILENRVGDPLIKGKTEKDLYRGEAQFEKLYAREVSRIYPGGKVNIVIYPKQSSIRYFTSGLS